eukprot:scaffold12102_cov19-Tisochrysis_lutea.AAC.4
MVRKQITIHHDPWFGINWNGLVSTGVSTVWDQPTIHHDPWSCINWHCVVSTHQPPDLRPGISRNGVASTCMAWGQLTIHDDPWSGGAAQWGAVLRISPPACSAQRLQCTDAHFEECERLEAKASENNAEKHVPCTL